MSFRDKIDTTEYAAVLKPGVSVKSTVLPGSYKEQATTRLRRMAEDDHAPYPQYAAHFDLWVLTIACVSAKYKGGSHLTKGRIVLASPDMTTWYDPDTGHLCGVSAGVLEAY
jgi:hypothetical protein